MEVIIFINHTYYATNDTLQIVKRISKIKDLLSQLKTLPDGFVFDPNTECCILEETFFLPKETYDKLYTHQREGITWLWKLYKNEDGGILADDMV